MQKNFGKTCQNCAANKDDFLEKRKFESRQKGNDNIGEFLIEMFALIKYVHVERTLGPFYSKLKSAHN